MSGTSHRFLMDVFHYFSGHEQFEIVAENKADAVEKGKLYISRNKGGNYQVDSVKVLKKLKPAKEGTST